MEALYDDQPDSFGNTVLFDRSPGTYIGLLELALSLDGKHAYVISRDAVSTFIRDQATGRLAFSQLLQNFDEDDEGNLVSGLQSPSDMVLSGDGKHLYIVNWGQAGVAAFSRSNETGALVFVASYKDGDYFLNNGVGLAISPDGGFLYARGQFETLVYKRNSMDGTLNIIETLNDGRQINLPRSLQVAPDGNRVYIANTYFDQIAIFDRNPLSGRLSFHSELPNAPGSCNLISGLDEPIAVALSPDETHLYAVSYGSHSIVIFERDAATGHIRFVDALIDGAVDHQGNTILGMRHPKSVVVSADGASVYVVTVGDGSVGSGAIVAFRRLSTGLLQFIASYQSDEPGFGGSAIAITADGSSVYSASTNFGIARFSRHSSTGALTFQDTTMEVFGSYSYGLAIAGDLLATVHNFPSELTLFSIDTAHGALTLVQRLQENEIDPAGTTITGLSSVASVALSPQGNQAYTLGRDGLIVVFDRDSKSGLFTLLQRIDLGGPAAKSSPPQIDYPELTISADGQWLYVADFGENRLFQLQRNDETGRLTLVSTLQQGQLSDQGRMVRGATGPTGVATTADGAHAYVASLGADVILVAGTVEIDFTNGFEIPVEQMSCYLPDLISVDASQ